MEYLVSVRESFSAEECKWMSGTMEDFFKDHADGYIAGIGGKHEGKTRLRKLRDAAVERALFAALKAASWVGPQESVLGLLVRAA